MHRRITASIALLGLSAAVLLPTAASAARAKPTIVRAPTARVVLENCTKSETGNLTRPFSARLLKLARRDIRGDTAEYTGCFDAVRDGLRRARSKIVVGIRTRSGGRYVAGRIVLRDARGRVVDVRTARTGERVSFLVPMGRYKLQQGTLKNCTKTISTRPHVQSHRRRAGRAGAAAVAVVPTKTVTAITCSAA